MLCTAEKPAVATPAVSDGSQPPQPPRKEDVLSQICALALAGQSCRQIAATFGLTKSTVNRWLQEMREDCPTRPAGCAEMVAAAVTRCWKLHYEALDAFHLSLEDKVTERVVETETARGRKKKRTIRTETHASKPAFLGAAIQAINVIARITALIAPRGWGERERGRKGEKERGKRVPVPRSHDGPVPLNALLEGEKGDRDAAERCAIEAKCPTGPGLPADAAEPQLSQPDMNAGGLVQERSAEENCLQTGQGLVQPRNRNTAYAVKCPIREKLAATPVPKGTVEGDRIAALLDAYGPAEVRQPTLFARLSPGHARPVMLAGLPLRSDSRREKLEFGFDCPIPTATRVSGRRGVLQGPLQKSGAGLQTVPS